VEDVKGMEKKEAKKPSKKTNLNTKSRRTGSTEIGRKEARIVKSNTQKSENVKSD
jgi:hypothetical protein